MKICAVALTYLTLIHPKSLVFAESSSQYCSDSQSPLGTLFILKFGALASELIKQVDEIEDLITTENDDIPMTSALQFVKQLRTAAVGFDSCHTEIFTEIEEMDTETRHRLLNNPRSRQYTIPAYSFMNDEVVEDEALTQTMKGIKDKKKELSDEALEAIEISLNYFSGTLGNAFDFVDTICDFPPTDAAEKTCRRTFAAVKMAILAMKQTIESIKPTIYFARRMSGQISQKDPSSNLIEKPKYFKDEKPLDIKDEKPINIKEEKPINIKDEKGKGGKTRNDPKDSKEEKKGGKKKLRI